MTTIGMFEILGPTLYFANKVLVLVGRKSGWLMGAIASFFAFAYFFLIGLYFLTVLQVGLLTLMIYGFCKKDGANPKAEMIVRVSTIVVMTALTFFAWRGVMRIVELASALGLLIGTYLLAHGKIKSGWLLYGVSHLLAAYLGYEKQQHYFADMQIASAVVSVIGCTKRKE